MTGPELRTSLKNNSLLLIIYFEPVFMQNFSRGGGWGVGGGGVGGGKQSALWSVPEDGDNK